MLVYNKKLFCTEISTLYSLVKIIGLVKLQCACQTLYPLISFMKKMPIQTNTVTRSHLLDYVTKSEFFDFKKEFFDFKSEMYDFRDEMYNFRNEMQISQNKTEKRFNDVDRRFDELKEEFRIQTGVLLDQMREERKIAFEYMRGLIPAK